MNEISTFKFGNSPLRAVMVGGEPWFIAKDVAEILGHKNPQRAVRVHVDDEDKGVTEMVTPGGTQQVVIINESGIYSLVFCSKVPQAKEFKRWVTHKVLPTIRKTGQYLVGKQDSYMIENRILRAKRWIEEEEVRVQLQDDNQKLKIETNVLKPKAEFFDQMMNDDCLSNFRDFAKQIGMKQKSLMHYLETNGYIYYDLNKSIRPKSGKGDGLFELKDFYNPKSKVWGKRTLLNAHGRYVLFNELKEACLINSVHSSDPEHELTPQARGKGHHSRRPRKVVCLETGTVYNSLNEASRTLGAQPSNITFAIRRNGTCKGYHWQYVE